MFLSLFFLPFQLNIDFREITEKYEKEFFEEMDSLNVIRPSHAPRVTENVSNILEYIQNIINNGNAYSVEDGKRFYFK